MRGLLEDIDEQPANGFPLFLWVGITLQSGKKARSGMDLDLRNVVGAADQPFDLAALAFAQDAVIDENTSQRIAERLMEQNGGHRGIDTAGEPANDLRIARLLADARHLGIAERGHSPGAAATRNPVQEIAD